MAHRLTAAEAKQQTKWVALQCEDDEADICPHCDGDGCECCDFKGFIEPQEQQQ